VGGIGHHPGALPGRGNASLLEPASGHANCLTARRACTDSRDYSPGALPGVGCTLCWAAFLTGPATPLTTDFFMKAYFPLRIKVIAKTSADGEIITGAAKCQALGT